jgi:hypothetical protein
VDSVVVPRGSCVVVVELVVVPPEGSGVTVVVVELLGGGSTGGGVVVVVVVVVVLPSEFTVEFVVLCASASGATAKPMAKTTTLASVNRPTIDLFISTSWL